MAQTITMTQKELARYEIIKRLIHKAINGTEAAKQLSLSVRQTKNIKAKVKKYGVKGIIHSSRGKSGNKGLKRKFVARMEKIVRGKYYDFGPTLTAEKLEERHNIKISVEKLRLLMISWDLWKPRARKQSREYRQWRPRKEQFGELQQFDGSYHHWFEDRADKCCLLAAIDDATGRLTKLKFVYDEGTIPVFSFWKDYLGKHGKPIAIYVDRLRTYKQNLNANVLDDPDARTQFQRAMELDLAIKVIHAYSPQAKGRAERLFKTLQDRLVKELRLRGISTIREANQFLEQEFVPQFNARFAVLPQKKGNLHRPLTKTEKNKIDKIFSVQTERTVYNDFTVKHNRQWHQLEQEQPTTVFKKDKVLIEERVSGEMFISLRGNYLNWRTLPKRPEKVKDTPIVLVRRKSSWKPPADHPWRRPFILNPVKRHQASSSSVSAS